MTPIPQTDPRASYLEHKAEIDAAVARVLDSGWYILGREAELFEAGFAGLIGVGHAIGCGNGTDALALALRACGVGQGDLVFTVSHTAVATVAAIEGTGATAVLIDIEEGGYCMDPAGLEAALEAPPKGRPAAVIPVHLYGEPAAMVEIVALARAHGLRVIEDCAQSHGARYQGITTGSIGDFGCYSFYPTKNLGAFGDAGAVVTGDDELAAAAREIREYGWRDRYVSAVAGINSRLDPIQAAILSVKLDTLEADNARRQAIAARYDAELADLPLALPRRRNSTTHVFHQYVVRTKKRGGLREHLRQGQIGTGIHYPLPVHLHPAYRARVPVGPTGLCRSEAAAREILSLPMFPQLTDDAVGRVIAETRRFFL
ncbi:MAG TPA: DegT/DnrJ/EryC1/StrS family aminotransferase [Stellaceae bacterium]|jgi:dTDP-4-amino-4,6-dideoxygalactose transaminase|nr:DegT/DnrJ/EryC1/StrS family aminotransferase [Stellaceae bacterium]